MLCKYIFMLPFEWSMWGAAIDFAVAVHMNLWWNRCKFMLLDMVFVCNFDRFILRDVIFKIVFLFLGFLSFWIRIIKQDFFAQTPIYSYGYGLLSILNEENFCSFLIVFFETFAADLSNCIGIMSKINKCGFKLFFSVMH